MPPTRHTYAIGAGIKPSCRYCNRPEADVIHLTVPPPEGVSVIVEVDDLPPNPFFSVALLVLAGATARALYPDTPFTGRVLHIERDAIGPNQHEVVLEVAPLT